MDASLLGPLLKLQPPVVVDGTDAVDSTEAPRRVLSIPATRLADARRQAANDTLTDTGTRDTLAALPFPSPHSEMGMKNSSPLVPPAAASLAAGKAALVEAANNKTTAAYPGGAVLPALMGKVSDVERLLYTLLPPKSVVCEETGATVMQFVSTEPSSRLEVSELHERLVRRLQQRCARDSGICPIRRQVYAEVFDELIRQVTLEEPARGILLLRVRDELDQTLAAHRSLAERAMYFASKQRRNAEEGMDVLKQRIKELEEERLELLVKRKAGQVREEQLLQAIEQENNARSKLWQDELGYYRRANRQLTQRIKFETERTNAHGVKVNTNMIQGEIAESKAAATT